MNQASSKGSLLAANCIPNFQFLYYLVSSTDTQSQAVVLANEFGKSTTTLQSWCPFRSAPCDFGNSAITHEDIFRNPGQMFLVSACDGSENRGCERYPSRFTSLSALMLSTQFWPKSDPFLLERKTLLVPASRRVPTMTFLCWPSLARVIRYATGWPGLSPTI